MDPTAKALRVLVVDDDRETRETLAYLIGQWGYDARAAEDGAGALSLAHAYRPDVILLDVAMPGMSGWETARRLRRDTGLQDAYVVSMSSFARNDDHVASREAGCDDHWAKPFDPDKLWELLAARQAKTGHRAR